MNRQFLGGLALIAAFAAVGLAQKGAKQADDKLMGSLRGPDLFQAYCATCHGKDAKGNGPAAASLKIHPADLTTISKRNKGTFPFLKIQKVISGEDMSPDAHGTREMPVWGPILSEVTWDQDLGKIRIYVVAKYLEEIQVK